jgi:hypothetical protein
MVAFHVCQVYNTYIVKYFVGGSMSNTVKLLNSLEYLYPENIVINRMKRSLNMFPECETAIVDAFSLGQIKSKQWLIDNLPDDLGIVFVCAGWYGTLASFMFDQIPGKFHQIRSFDIDPTCAPVADHMNKFWVADNWRFKASTMDVYDMTYPAVYTTYKSNSMPQELTEMPNTIINTSTEHFDNFKDWYEKIPNNVLIVIQGNDFEEIEEHVNISKSLEEFSNKAPMSSVLYEGELQLQLYKRFMKIGFK